MPSTKTPPEPRTFRDLEAESIPGRPLSGPAKWARQLQGKFGIATEAECVTIAAAVGASPRRRYYDARGLWTTAGEWPNDGLILLPGYRPEPEDA